MNNVPEGELRPIYAKQKSFYGKAIVFYNSWNNALWLRSYSTIVAGVDTTSGLLYVNELYSDTTTKHIKEFVAQATGEYLTVAELRQKYIGKTRISEKTWRILKLRKRDK